MANSSNENPPSSPTNPLNTSNNDAADQTPPPPPPSPPPPPPPPAAEAIQESNTAPPATPPPAIQSGGGGSSGEGSNPKKKKRGKKPGEAVEDQQGSGQKKKRGEMDAPKREPVCCVCGKKFASWKAVFGHFRAHSGREWRGAFPPPTGDALAWLPPNLPPEESLAPTLLRLARETLEKMTDENISGAGSGSRVVLDFDLNKPPPEEEADVAAGSAAIDGGDEDGLDLNMVPLEEHKDVEMAEDKGEGDA